MNCTNYKEQREKKKKKILKTYQSFNYNTSRSIRKILMRRIQRHQERSSKMTGVSHIFSPKTSKPPTTCNPLQSLFVIFFSIVGFLSSRSFQWYQWYHNRGFGVPPCLFLSLFFFILFFHYNCSLSPLMIFLSVIRFFPSSFFLIILVVL